MSTVETVEPIQHKFQNPNPGHCRTCGADVKHPAQYCDEHRPAQAKKKPRQSGRAEAVTPSGREVLRDLPTAKKTATGKVTQEATAKFLGTLLFYLLLFVTIGFVERLMPDEDEPIREQTVGQLQMSKADAASVARPIARFLTPTTVWQRVGPALVGNADAIDAIVAMYDWVSGLVRFARAARKAQAAPTNGHAGAPGTLEPFTPAPAHVYEGPAYTAPEEWGQQVGPSSEQLEEIRRRHQGFQP